MEGKLLKEGFWPSSGTAAERHTQGLLPLTPGCRQLASSNDFVRLARTGKCNAELAKDSEAGVVAKDQRLQTERAPSARLLAGWEHCVTPSVRELVAWLVGPDNVV